MNDTEPSTRWTVPWLVSNTPLSTVVTGCGRRVSAAEPDITPWPPPEAVCSALPHREQPHVCVRMTAQQPFGRGIIIVVDLN